MAEDVAPRDRPGPPASRKAAPTNGFGAPSLEGLDRRGRGLQSAGLLLVGASLGAIPGLLGADPASNSFLPSLLGALTILIVGGASWGIGARAHARRVRLLQARGTAYVVDAAAEGWTPEGKDAYLKGASTEFAQVLQVPGPNELTNANWRWPLGAGAERWGAGVDDLVLAFRSVFVNDIKGIDNCVVCWAWWSVAIGWAARLTSTDRSLVIQVKQRPSHGREGVLPLPPWDQAGHTFTRPKPAPKIRCSVVKRSVTLRFSSDNPSTDHGPETPVRVLFVRMLNAAWGDLSLDTPTDAPLEIEVSDRSGLGLHGPVDAQLWEWQLTVPPGAFHPWADYPGAVAEICEWIARDRCPDGVTLLGMLVPQEVALGVGLNVAQRHEGEWPAHMWPLMNTPGARQFVIPGLDLGLQSLHTSHLDGPR